MHLRDYEKFVAFINDLGYELDPLQKKLIKAMCEGKVIYMSRGYGRNTIKKTLELFLLRKKKED